jgi:hypothetical protein
MFLCLLPHSDCLIPMHSLWLRLYIRQKAILDDPGTP